MNQKNVTRAQWEALRYPIELQQLSTEEGGGWMAWIPLLGRGLFMVDAPSAAEAIERLEHLRLELYDLIIASGRPIPLPSDVTDEPQASGKWLQRASRRLHSEMRAAAERDGVSFNTYCENAMLRGHMTLAAETAMSNLAEGICEDFKMRVAVEAQKARYEFAEVRGAEVTEDAAGYDMMKFRGWDEEEVA
ncbi:MAG TPA: hypothetical protein PLV39_14395 [Fimbriimonadaceae bacterium]|nr:hypothetical protein [Fimbriimonadaceae bacterium]